MYLKHHAYLFNIHSTKHDKETETQNELHVIFRGSSTTLSIAH